MKKNFLLTLLSILAALFLIEVFLRINSLDSAINIKEYYFKYTKPELDKNLPFRKDNHGGKCVNVNFSSKMKWHSRKGFHDKDVNIDCVDKLFSSKNKNIIFMGGSAMANYQTPNYLTSIEYFFEKNFLKDFRSINLAEGGGRMSNNLNSFIEYIPKLKNKPDFIIFLDGYNEFLPLLYGGKPSDDFYYTTTVKDRIHNINKYLFFKIIEKSEVLKIIFYKTFNIKNTRIVKKNIDQKKIIKAANDYLYRKNIIKNLCNNYKIKCIFLLQPVFSLTKNINGKFDKRLFNIEKYYFSSSSMTYNLGYSLLVKDPDIYNLSNIFDNKNDIFIDMVHFNKTGSEIIGQSINKILANLIDK